MIEDTEPSRPFVHATVCLDDAASLAPHVEVWHFSHIMTDARIGERTKLGQNVFVGRGVSIGARCKVQNNVSLYEGVTLEDDVFCGPSCVFTNVVNPRAEIVRRAEIKPTLVQRGATIGANSTIVCGVTVGRFAFVAAGAVVTSDVPAYTLVSGVPARPMGWIGRHGERLRLVEDGRWSCPASGWTYRETTMGSLECIDWPEEAPLP